VPLVTACLLLFGSVDHRPAPEWVATAARAVGAPGALEQADGMELAAIMQASST
jgi:hypothetical protein